MRRFLGALALMGAGMCLDAYIRSAVASRNGAGTMSAVNGPYITGNTISSTQVNNRLADIETEITDSLSRSAKGGMLQSLRLADGTVGTPALSYTNEVGSGEYRIGSNDFGWAIGGVKKLELTGSLFTVVPNATFSGSLGVGVSPLWPLHVVKTAVSGATALAGTSMLLESNGTHYLSIVAPNANQEGILFGDVASSSRGYIIYTNSAAGSPDQLQFATGAGTIRAFASNSGFTIGTSGAAIAASYRGTASPGGSTVNANTCRNTSVTVTGAAAGDSCAVGVDSGAMSTGLILGCDTAANACTVRLCNVTTGNIVVGAMTYSCRTFNP